MDMVERVKAAIIDALKASDEGGVIGPYAEGQALTLDGHFDMDVVAKAAISSIFAGSRMTEYRGGIVVANPDLQIHFWNGTSMEEIKFAEPDPPIKKTPA